MTFEHQVYLYFFPSSRFEICREVSVLGHEPMSGRAFGTFSEIAEEKKLVVANDQVFYRLNDV